MAAESAWKSRRTSFESSEASIDGGLLRVDVARHEHEVPTVRKERGMEVRDLTPRSIVP